MAEHRSLSIAICTYNRAHQLKPLLQQLQALGDCLSPCCEVLLIDNNSTDNTAELAASFDMPFEFKLLHEEKQGLANARNCALQHFTGDAIVFFDDDVSVSRECLQAYSNALTQQPAHDYFGGPIDVDWQGEKPKWLKSDDLSLLFGLFGRYNPATQDTLYDGSIPDPYGANFMLLRNTVNKVGLFNADLGVSGDAIGRGEETEYLARARQQGLSGKYLVAARVGHCFQIERVNMAYLYRYGLEKGRAEVQLNDAKSNAWLLSSSSFALKGVWQLLRGRRDRMYQCVINIGISRGWYKAGRA